MPHWLRILLEVAGCLAGVWFLCAYPSLLARRFARSKERGLVWLPVVPLGLVWLLAVPLGFVWLFAIPLGWIGATVVSYLRWNQPPADPLAPLIEVSHLVKHFPVKQGVFSYGKGVVHAVEDISLTVNRGETLGIVGESGCGKTTTARLIVRLLEPTSGNLRFEGRDISRVMLRDLRPLRREIQIIFQDPYSSLNPRKSVRQLIGEPMAIHRTEKDVKGKVQELLARVGLNPEHINRYPHEFSGGQRQRIGIARALALQPKLIVCDEPVSALDVSVQAQILNLLKDLQREFDLTYIFISHDLSVIRQVSDRIAVMYVGRVVEIGDSELLYEHPRHPYTAALLSAVPRPETNGSGISRRQRIVLSGDVPSPVNPPAACVFHPRCPRFQPGHCDVETPLLRQFEGDHMAACHYPVEHWPMTEDELRRPFAGSAAPNQS